MLNTEMPHDISAQSYGQDIYVISLKSTQRACLTATQLTLAFVYLKIFRVMKEREV